MPVTVRLFAGLREQAGWSTREIEANRVSDVWGKLDLGAEPEGLLYAVNKEYADRDAELADGDVVALIPPVSGGAFVLTEDPVSLDRVVDERWDPPVTLGVRLISVVDDDVQHTGQAAYLKGLLADRSSG